jgi:sporulation protein YlmC with PRC-barrel domain
MQSIKQLYGNKLRASDGDIGHVKDFYFDDKNWVIRYVVVDTGSWLSGRPVLISPHSFGFLKHAGHTLPVNLTRKQIEGSPSIDLHKTVSRKYEEEYYRYYGWPFYWQGGGVWGMGGFPILETITAPFPGQPGEPAESALESADSNLRSTQAVSGYQLQTGDAMIGHVRDFMMDPRDWVIRQLVVTTGHRLSGKEVLIDIRNVQRISYDDSTIVRDLTEADIEQTNAHHLVSEVAID